MAGERQSRTVVASLNGALHDMMAGDERVVVIGEDLLDPYGGAFKVTAGLSTRFPDRVLTTPISESAIVGVAAGAALRGLRPIAEIMFGDFLMLAADQLVNHAAKFRWMYNEQVRVPLVVRTPSGGRRGYGATHSQSLEKHLMGVPGLWIVAPNVFGEPGALLRQAALECDDPVVFVENKAAYAAPLLDGLDGYASQTITDAAAPFPTQLLLPSGLRPDAVLSCYGGMAGLCAEAVVKLRDEEGLSVALANLHAGVADAGVARRRAGGPGPARRVRIRRGIERGRGLVGRDAQRDGRMAGFGQSGADPAPSNRRATPAHCEQP